MKWYSFHHADTGLFDGRRFYSTDSEGLAVNTPPDHVAIEGRYDPLSQRVDLATGKVVDYQPPAPSSDHEWNETTKRWQLTAAAEEHQARRAAALGRIAVLESAQHRPLRELAQDPRNAEARKRLDAIDAEIAALRMDVG